MSIESDTVHRFVREVRKKFRLDLKDKSGGYWKGYSDAIDDVENLAERLEHDPTGACLLADKNYEGDHIVPPWTIRY